MPEGAVQPEGSQITTLTEDDSGIEVDSVPAESGDDAEPVSPLGLMGSLFQAVGSWLGLGGGAEAGPADVALASPSGEEGEGLVDEDEAEEGESECPCTCFCVILWPFGFPIPVPIPIPTFAAAPDEVADLRPAESATVDALLAPQDVTSNDPETLLGAAVRTATRWYDGTPDLAVAAGLLPAQVETLSGIVRGPAAAAAGLAIAVRSAATAAEAVTGAPRSASRAVPAEQPLTLMRTTLSYPTSPDRPIPTRGGASSRTRPPGSAEDMG
jgi:hypothetical protein